MGPPGAAAEAAKGAEVADQPVPAADIADQGPPAAEAAEGIAAEAAEA